MCSVISRCALHLEDGLRVLLLVAFRDLGPGRQCYGHFPAPSNKTHFGHRSGRDPQPVPRGWADPALDFSIFEPAGGHPEEARGGEDHRELQEAQPNQHVQPAADSSRGPGPRLLGLRTGFFPVRLGFFVLPNKGAYGYGSPYNVLHTHKPLRVARHAQGSSALPGWFVKVINEVIKGLQQVAAYHDDAIAFDSDPTAHVQTIRSLFEHLRKHNRTRSPSNARLGATDANFVGHSIFPAGLRPSAENVSALVNICLLYTSPSPRD